MSRGRMTRLWARYPHLNEDDQAQIEDELDDLRCDLRYHRARRLCECCGEAATEPDGLCLECSRAGQRADEYAEGY